ncbi:hypothetical protein F2P81_002113 [Scophthalmus maximus]|uniref:Uncharacterized protein n=1 Tax=Scophthalmus maximus TaxID=52904 RepID=A0A6A4TQS5_SCOMX|nr:hypothetical protein F2P81_002113 [Scophthalmus maximus]
MKNAEGDCRDQMQSQQQEHFQNFQEEQDTEDFVDCGEAKNIDEINKDTRHDDILEPQNTQNSVVIQDDFLWTSPVAYVLENDLGGSYNIH